MAEPANVLPKVSGLIAAFLTERHGRTVTVAACQRLFADLGVDSLAATELVARLERAMGVRLSPEQELALADVITVAELATLFEIAATGYARGER